MVKGFLIIELIRRKQFFILQLNRRRKSFPAVMWWKDSLSYYKILLTPIISLKNSLSYNQIETDYADLFEMVDGNCYLLTK